MGIQVGGEIFSGGATIVIPQVAGTMATQEYVTENSDTVVIPELIDVFLVGGQSNAQGQGDSSLSQTIEPGVAYQYYNSIFEEVLGDPIGNATTGSAWPSFAIKYNSITGRKVCFVPTGVPSSSQVAAADPGGGTWDTTGTLYGIAVAKLQEALVAISNAGYTSFLKGILWCQGEADAGAITATTINKAQYKTALTTMIANFRTEFGSALPFLIFRTGGADTVGRTDVMAAQGEVATADYFTNLVFINAVDFPSRGLNNGAHYLQAGYDEMGDVGAINTSQGATQEPIAIQYNKVGIGTLLPTDTLHVVGTTRLEGAAVATSTLGVTGVATFSDTIATGAATLTKDIGAAAAVWRITYTGTINSGTGNALTLRTANATQSIILQVATTVGLRIAPTTANVLIGGSTDAASAILNLESTSKGLLIPRMTGAQVLAISSPAQGLMVFATSTSGAITAIGWWGYNGSAWVQLG